MKNLIIQPNIKYYFSLKSNKLFLKSNNYIIFLYLPSYYFYKLHNKDLDFIFINKFLFMTFFKQLILFSKIINKIYFLKLRMRGLVIEYVK